MLRKKKFLVVLLSLCMIMGGMTFGTAYADTAPSLSVTKAYTYTSNNYSSDYVKVNIVGSKITVSGKTVNGYKYFRIIVRNDKDGKSAFWGTERSIKDKAFSQTFYTSSFNKKNISGRKGDIVIRMARTKGNYSSAYYFQGVPINYSTLSKPYLMKYNGVINRNNDIKTTGELISPDAFLDATMATEDSQDGGALKMTSYQVGKMKTWSDEICKGATTDYGKMLKIFRYVSKNVYYDWYAFVRKDVTPVYNPYSLMYAIKNSKAKTVCDGFAGLVTALARSQGIPARTVAGHALSTPTNNWSTEKSVSYTDHVWSEAFVNGRWIVLDANRGGANMYYRKAYKSRSQSEYVYRGITRYTEFDMTDFGLANTKLYFSYRGGPISINYISDPEEIKQLEEFLGATNPATGVVNGNAFNPNFQVEDHNTWVNTGTHSITPTGQVSQLSFRGESYNSTKRLGGDWNLSGFEKLKVLTAYNGDLTSINLSGCTSLTNVSLNYQKITRLDLTSTRQLKTLSFKSNPAKSIRFRKKNLYITTITATGSGTIGCSYNTTKNLLEIIAKPENGSFIGIVDGNGVKKAATKNADGTYSVKTTSPTNTYKVTFSD